MSEVRVSDMNAPLDLTIVVNFRPEQPEWHREPTDRERYIGKQQLYDLKKLQSVPLTGETALLTTRDCKHDVAIKLESDLEIVLDALKLLTEDNYVNSQWCRTTGKSWIPCDAYLVPKWPVKVKGSDQYNVYIKFGMSKAGKCLLIVSCHPSGDENEVS